MCTFRGEVAYTPPAEDVDAREIQSYSCDRGNSTRELERSENRPRKDRVEEVLDEAEVSVEINSRWKRIQRIPLAPGLKRRLPGLRVFCRRLGLSTYSLLLGTRRRPPSVLFTLTTMGSVMTGSQRANVPRILSMGAFEGEHHGLAHASPTWVN